MTMQRVDDRHRLSLPLFYPHFKPGLRKSRISQDGQSFESSAGSPRSPPSAHKSNHNMSTRQQRVSDSGRPNEPPLKSCLRKSNGNDGNAKENIKDADRDMKNGDFKDADSDVTSTTAENRKKLSKRKWKSTKIGHKDKVESNSENTKMKGCSYTRFRYPLRFHYGSVIQSKSKIISAIPAGLRTYSFYSSLPRRQRQIVPDTLSSEKGRRGKDGKRNHERERSPDGKHEGQQDSRASSPEKELNGVYHIVHETATAEVHDTKAVQKQKSKATHEQKTRTTHEQKTRTTQNRPDSDDDEASEVADDESGDLRRPSSKNSHSGQSEESLKDAVSSSNGQESLKKEKNESGSSDDEDLSRSRKKEDKKTKKKTKNGNKDNKETEYAADFDQSNSEVLSED